MSLHYTKPIWTNDEGTAINAERLQAISDVLDGLVNKDGTKPIVHLSFSGTFMTATFADGTIETVENPLKGEKGDQGEIGPEGPAGERGPEGPAGPKGETGATGATGPKGDNGKDGINGIDGKDGANGTSLTASSSKTGKTTTLEIKNAETGEVITTLTIEDGADGTGSGDMSKAEYASNTYGVVNKALNSEYADEANLAAVAAIADSVEWANTNHPTTLEGYGLVSDVTGLIDTAIGGAINDSY